jgi:hypothetical protein
MNLAELGYRIEAALPDWFNTFRSLAIITVNMFLCLLWQW